MRNVYYFHKKYSDFSRTLTLISDSAEQELHLDLVEYHFSNSEHSVSPHKKERKKKPFIPTAPSTRKGMFEHAKSHKGPSTIFDEAVEKCGGILHCDVMADLPRDMEQVKNCSAKSK